ncbi:hypothetical protein LK12_16855 [Novosphingobium malaysiense]|uniref:Thioesterase domain-containing protein n=1 Tax=Novosphingobium malaysiense TaxID=1348853 RepID=A0A0B1ZMG8_9SPHN|nr:hypothetical protein LK12_16855 [Novosphingobium malaysiense]
MADKGNNALLGIRYHAHSPEWIELAMPWSEAFVDDPAAGSMATGAIMTLLDNTAGTSIYLQRGGFLPQVTLDLRADYLRPAKPRSTIICRSECFKWNASTALTRGIAYDETPEDPVCHVTATFMLL